MIYILFFCIAIVAITITKFAVPFILSRARIPHHLVTIVNFFLNIAVLLLTFFVLLFSLQAIGIINTTDEIAGEQSETTIHQLEDEKASRISKEENQLAKEKERERIEQERLQELEAENERQRIELEKQRLAEEKERLRKLEEEKERERIEEEQKRLQEELEAEKERHRIELEKQRLAEEKERLRKLEEENERKRVEQEQKRLRELEAEKIRQRMEQKRLRELIAKKERERIEQERLRKLEAEKVRQRIEQRRLRELVAKKKSPCEIIQDSLDKSLLSYALKKPGNEMTILRNKQGVNCYIIPNGTRGGCIEYQIQKEGSSELCFYKECTRR
ncbi:MAG: hypothetical protein Q3M24_17700 [Candidatus Electrothrix aestuarii]|uniref:Uncharacterized protein n=1 Tax=Candidatus Electrothrix aestuarii TaxID=3062594 RepID=A0AAU8LTD0_9BACT|nr:hypothetical protein [Candidatus Electrothrix aestuarii]